MANLTIESIYTKQDEQTPEYLVVVFETNQGLFKVGYGQFEKLSDINLENFQRDFLDELKSKYGILEILDLRVTYDNEMYFLISNKFLLVLGYTLSSETEYSTNEIWIEEDIHGANQEELKEFYELNKVNLSADERER